MALVKIYISCIIISWGKNHFELVGTVLNMDKEMPLLYHDGLDLERGLL